MLTGLTPGHSIRTLKDRLGLGLGPATDNRIHLDAAIAWLKHAQDVTGNGGVAQTYLVKYRKWAPSYPETTGTSFPPSPTSSKIGCKTRYPSRSTKPSR